jgi:outer membrane receptor protein involved in Fe transport
MANKPKDAIWWVSATALAAGIAFPAAAQDSPAPPEQEELASPAADEAAAQGEIIVTGSRLGRAGFNAPTPVTVLGSAAIERQGASNVSEVLNQVPAFRAQNTPQTSGVFVSNVGAATADLRGLGANRTLVLIDGRRVVASTVAGGSFTPANTVDLNMVPTALIERADVVTGGASAAYGSDAVAGVINLVLNKKLTGVRGSAQYGISDRGDVAEYVLSLAGGTQFARGRGHAMIGVEYVDNKGSGDCYTRAWCARSFNTVSNPAFRTNGLPAVNILENHRTATATVNGMINSGPLLGTEFSRAGGTFQHNYGTYYGAGIFQAGGGDARAAFYEFYPLSAPVERLNIFGRSSFELTDGVSIYGEASYGRASAAIAGAQRRDVAPVTMRTDNPFLPASVAADLTARGLQTFTIGRIWDDIGPQLGEVKRETYRLVTGIDAELGGDWKLGVYYQYGQTDYRQRTSNTTINSRMARALDAVAGPNGPTCRSLLSADPAVVAAAAGCVPINPFGAGSPSAQAIAYVTGTAAQDTRLTQHVASIELRGSLAELWAGPLAVATGAEYREDRAFGTADPISLANDFYVNGGSAIDGRIRVSEAFVEASLPLARDTAFAKSLDLNGAFRITDYSSIGSVSTWKLGGTWDFNDWIRLRATRSRDIRAPNIFELYAPAVPSFQTVTDPLNGGAQVLPRVLFSGNPALREEVAGTWTAGIILQPSFGNAGRLRFSLDWFNIKLRNAVSTLGGQIIVNRCATNQLSNCSELVVRAGGAANGTIQTVLNYNLNLNNLHAQGVDGELSYTLPLQAIGIDSSASMSFRLLGTYTIDLITTDASGVSVDRAGMNGAPASQPSGVPRLQLQAAARYDGGPFSAELQARHISSGRYNATLIGPDEAGYSNTLPNSVNINRVPPRTYFNLNTQYAIWQDGNRKVELSAVVNNLFDRTPPVTIPSSFGTTNNVLYDILGRYYRVGVRFAF